MANLDEIGMLISNSIEVYAKDVQVKLKAEMSRTADDIINDVKLNCVRSGNPNALADSFAKYEKRDEIVIYSKTKAPLVHLIEFGFCHRSGRFVAARPFLRPARDRNLNKMFERFKKIIQDG